MVTRNFAADPKAFVQLPMSIDDEISQMAHKYETDCEIAMLVQKVAQRQEDESFLRYARRRGYSW